jgi:glycosyltransferase involved in cell wall biosynthesis
MKVLHVSFSDGKGGAGIAACRLHKAMRAIGIDSSMLVAEATAGDAYVTVQWPGRLGGARSRLRQRLAIALMKLQKSPNASFHSPNFLPSRLHRRINAWDADIVNLHWMGAELMSVEEIGLIEKPLVWTLHDTWAFCGAEHYFADGDRRWRDGYRPSNRPPGHRGWDIDRWVWNRKKRAWLNLDVHYVCPSRWMARQVSESALSRGRAVSVIPNGVDTACFRPHDRRLARQRWNLPPDRHLILFGARGGVADPRKGFSHLLAALRALAARGSERNIGLVIFGDAQTRARLDAPFETFPVGQIEDPSLMAMLYSAADVFVAPSTQDNLPNTVVESLACGTPCVGFDVGGMSDLIDHQACGYLARPLDPGDLALGIEWVLGDERRHAALGLHAREKALSAFDATQVAGRYGALFSDVLRTNSTRQ